MTVAECALADAVMAGVEPAPLASARPARLIVARGLLFANAEPAVLEAFEAGLEKFRHAGFAVEDGSLEPILEKLAEIDALGGFPSIEVGATLRDLGIENLDEVDPKTRARIELGANIPAVNYVRMVRRRAAAIAAFEQALTADEAYVVPTCPILAPPRTSVRDDAGFHRMNGLVLRNPRVANLLDCPSISLPLPSPGLPVGLMLIGRRGADRRLLAMAAALEGALA